MSKVVKGVGRAVGKVVKGAVNVVKKVAKSKIGKVILTAAAVYFTGGAALGAIQGAAAGTGMLSGAASGLSAAWSGVTGAASALAGGSLSGAASSLGAGWANAAGAATGSGFTGALAKAGGDIAGVFGAGAPSVGASSVPVGGAASQGAGLVASPAAPGAGFLKTALNSAPLMHAVGGVAKGAMQAKAMNDQQEYQDERDVEDRARYNSNMGANVSFFDQLAARYQQPGVRG